MSGGVDSSVAAWLLKEQGYDVVGVTMQIWQDEEEQTQEENGGCCGLSAVEDARRVAQTLEIPYYVMNFKAEFKEKVMDYFAQEYLCGRTPNPCIACNRYVKWEALLQRSLSIGADSSRPDITRASGSFRTEGTPSAARQPPRRIRPTRSIISRRSSLRIP